VTSTISFEPNGEMKNPAITLYVYKDGKEDRIVQRSPARLVDVSASSNQSAGKLKVAFERNDHQRAFVLLCPGFNVGFRPVDQHGGNLG
jgi:hypothetical protein